MNYFPFFFNLKNKPILLVGGGITAFRKYKLLKKAHARVHVVSKSISPELLTLLDQNNDNYEIAFFDKNHITNAFLAVIAATEDVKVNKQIEASARALNIPVNVVDSPTQCDFIFPAILERGEISVAVSSSGVSPVLARLIKSRIEAVLPNHLTEMTEVLAKHRALIKSSIVDPEDRKNFYEQLFHNGFEAKNIGLSLNGVHEKHKETSAFDSLENQLLKTLSTYKKPLGSVALIGAGSGDPELLTLKALRYLQLADVILTDRLVGPAVLELCRRDAHFIDVGKKKGFHKKSQDEINELLLHYAREGKQVVRLKGGDPYIFGRGGEEALFLVRHGISTTVVPGVTAALAASAIAGIPLTHRDYSHSVILTTAYKEDMRNPRYWLNLVQSKSTLVFYMGQHVLQEMADALLRSGMSASKPVALVSNASLPEQQVVVTTLKEASKGQLKSLPSPTLIIVGEVVKLRSALIETAHYENEQQLEAPTQNFLLQYA